MITVLKKPKILAIVGPTASGKSALAEALCKRLGGEVVSCDSMQVYRGMDIGTAKPDAATLREIPYHLLDVADPTEDFSMVAYLEAAERAVGDILARGKLPILCGGTGLYLDAFLRGMPESPGGDAALREALLARATCEGNEALHAELAAVDPESAAATHPSNVRRVIRALEIYRTTGVTKTEWDRRSRTQPMRYDATVLYLCFEDRELLYRRIEARVEQMIKQGLVEETRALRDRGVFKTSGTAAAAIGYKELLPYLDGTRTLDEAVADLKQATRRYAKRQITWFSAKSYVTPILADRAGMMRNFEEIVNNAVDIVTARA
ncbi:MAG: tRNA (adenosine(37)-N6)-dimethylallyltransferase MiaA [Ruminococcaceae bacterium]|nr:tRNA (adenosine(37)-N6)-dimethylallyltransferase MiaA [Oscillospiraceae bacterium]